jgi:hypothetical protein
MIHTGFSSLNVVISVGAVGVAIIFANLVGLQRANFELNLHKEKETTRRPII